MKREFWKRKKTKRRKRAEADRGIVDFIKVVKHFFTSLPDWISEMEDPRNESYILYTQSDLICMGLLKNVCSVPSMRQMEDLFNEECCIKTLAILSGNPELEEMPHSDTLNYYLSRLSPECLDGLRTRMVRSLIRSKNFNKARLLDKYWRIILDGTGLYVFHERHCDNCLKQLVNGEDGTKKTIYYHKVLEAKIVLGGGFVISIGTEFIENESLDVTKQDCELNAAKRLLPRIKEKFPRLPIILVQYYKGIIVRSGLKIDNIIAVSSLIDWCLEDGTEIDVEDIDKLPIHDIENLRISFDGRYHIEELLDILESAIQDFEAQMGLRMAARLSDVVHRMAKHLNGIFSTISAGVAITPIPVSDIYVLIILQAVLVSLIASLSGRDVSIDSAIEFIFSMGGIASAGVVFRVIAQQASKLINLIWPGTGSVISSGIAALGKWSYRFQELFGFEMFLKNHPEQKREIVGP